MSGDTKVLTGLMERRALEAAFGELAEITDPEQLARRAREIAQHGDSALTVLIAMLDTNDPQLRGGLGQVASHLDRDAVVAALRGVALTPGRNDRSRLSALTILDRYLHEPVNDELLAGLQDSDAVARESLSELLREMERNPYAIMEYMTQLAEQPAEVVYLILEAIPPLQPNPYLVTLLRLLAQDADAALAREALDQLGRVRSGDAARALASLEAVLPPELSALGERSRRKLSMSGVRVEEADMDAEPWSQSSVMGRTLISPLDAAGAQVLLFIGPADAEGRCRVLSIVTQDALGITGCMDLHNLPVAELPQLRTIGFVHRIPGRSNIPPTALLEAQLATGTQILREAIQWNWRGNTPTPLQYRLVNPCIWLNEDSGDDIAVPEVTPAGIAHTGDPASLLEHPAFAGWHWWPADRLPRTIWRQPNAKQLLVELALEQFGQEVCAAYVRRLHAMARWLALAGDTNAAALATTAAGQLEAGRPEESLFALRLVMAGFELARRRYSTIEL